MVVINKWFFLIAVCFVPLLHCMENTIVMPESERLAWHIALTHGVALFDSKMISALAKTRRAYDTILCQTAQYRKHYFVESDDCLKEINDTIGLEGIEWHKYGAVCGKVVMGRRPHWPLRPFGMRGFSPNRDMELIMERRCLKGGWIGPCYQAWGGLHNPLPCQPQAFFNERGDFCCYSLNECGNIMKYSLSKDGSPEINLCVTRINKYVPAKYFSLSILMEFPTLLQAFLHASHIFEQSFNSKNDLLVFNENKKLEWNHLIYDVTVFDLQAIIIPKNYKEYKQSYFNRYTSFDELPKIIRKAIVALYEGQRKSRAKKKNILSCFG